MICLSFFFLDGTHKMVRWTIHHLRNYGLLYAFLGVAGYWLRPSLDLWTYTALGVALNALLNIVLKACIRQRRPNIRSDIEWKRVHLEALPWLPIDHYGMPSGHAQFCGFLTTFLWNIAHPRYPVLSISIPLSIAVGVQRVVDRYHTPLQVLVGYLVGLGVGTLVAHWTKQHLRQQPRPRADDNHLGEPTLGAL